MTDTRKPFARDIEEIRHRLESAETDYLRRWGWSSTCHTPGSYWMWSRSFDDYNARWDEWNAKVAATGKGTPHAPYPPMIVDKATALRITLQCLDQRPEDGEAFDD